MTSNSLMGDIVRNYFVQLQEFLYEHHIKIYKILNQKRALKEFKKKELIYFFVVDERRPDILKLGTTKDIIGRLNTYTTGRIKEPELKYVAIVKHKKIIEKCAQRAALKSRLYKNKELFRIQPEKLKRIIEICYRKNITIEEHEELCNELSILKNLYKYVKDKKYIKPFIKTDMYFYHLPWHFYV